MLPTLPRNVLATCSKCKVLISECSCIRKLRDPAEKEKRLYAEYMTKTDLFPLRFSDKLKKNDPNYKHSMLTSFKRMKYVDAMLSEKTGEVQIVKLMEELEKTEPMDDPLYVRTLRRRAHSALLSARLGLCTDENILKKIDLFFSKEVYDSLDTVFLGQSEIDIELYQPIKKVLRAAIFLLKKKGVVIDHPERILYNLNNIAVAASLLAKNHMNSKYFRSFEGSCVGDIYKVNFPYSNWEIGFSYLYYCDGMNRKEAEVDPIFSTDPKNIFRFLDSRFFTRQLFFTDKKIKYESIRVNTSLRYLNALVYNLDNAYTVCFPPLKSGSYPEHILERIRETRELVRMWLALTEGIDRNIKEKMEDFYGTSFYGNITDRDLECLIKYLNAISTNPEKILYLLERAIILKLYMFITVCSIYGRDKLLHIESITAENARKKLMEFGDNSLDTIKSIEEDIVSAIRGRSYAEADENIKKDSPIKEKEVQLVEEYFTDIFDQGGIFTIPENLKMHSVPFTKEESDKALNSIEETKEKSIKDKISYLYNFHPCRFLRTNGKFTELPLCHLGGYSECLSGMYMAVYINKLILYKDFVFFSNELYKNCKFTQKFNSIKFKRLEALSDLSALKKWFYRKELPISPTTSQNETSNDKPISQ